MVILPEVEKMVDRLRKAIATTSPPIHFSYQNKYDYKLLIKSS